MTWWLVTWSTYGSWLPGDPRGFQTWRGQEYVPPPKRYAKPGEETYDSSKYVERHREAKMMLTSEVVHLSIAQRKCVLDAVVEQIAKVTLIPAALSVSGEHCHLLSKFGALKIRPTIGVLKGEATKALRETGFEGERIWSRECHPKSKREGNEFLVALKYVKNHERQNAAVYVWPAFQGIFHEQP